MLVLSDQTLQIVYLETAYQAQMQKILPSNQIVAKKLQHIFQLIKIQSIAHYILYGLQEIQQRTDALIGYSSPSLGMPLTVQSPFIYLTCLGI